MFPINDGSRSQTAGWLSAFTDWIEIVQLVHDLAASGQTPADSSIKSGSDNILTRQWLEELVEKRKEIEQTLLHSSCDNGHLLLQLWNEYSKNLPLAIKDLSNIIQKAASTSELSRQQLLAIESYLEAIKNQQLLFLDIARDSLDLLIKKHGNSLFEKHFERWFDQWSQRFDEQFSVVALTDEYSAQFAELVNSGLDVRMALNIDRSTQC